MRRNRFDPAPKELYMMKTSNIYAIPLFLFFCIVYYYDKYFIIQMTEYILTRRVNALTSGIARV